LGLSILDTADGSDSELGRVVEGTVVVSTLFLRLAPLREDSLFPRLEDMRATGQEGEEEKRERTREKRRSKTIHDRYQKGVETNVILY